MKSTVKTSILLLALVITVRAAPVTIDEALAQDPAPTGTVTIIETQECCEDKKGVPWWPFLFAGAVPLVFLGDDEQPRIEIQPPTNTPTPTPEPVPEPPTLSLGLLAVAGIFVWKKRKVIYGN